MADLFSQVLNMSLTGSLVILFVIGARLLLKKVSKVFSYALWAVVLFRLLCPVSLPSPVSLLELFGPEVVESSEVTTTVSYLPVRYVYSRAGEDSGEAVQIRQEAGGMSAAEEPESLSLLDAASYIWAAGIAVMGLYSIVVYARLRWRLLGAMQWRGEVCLADHIDSPFAMGIFHPRIYLPSSVPMQERRYIIAHERHHIRRGDHIIKLLAYTALCIHWFNPLVWAAFLLAGKDMEMSCDEAVIRKLGEHVRADYSASLLRLATHRTVIAGTPLAFGEGDTKGRVRNMAKWKAPKVWVSVLCSILCLLVLTACAVNPEENQETQPAISETAGAQETLPEPTEAGRIRTFLFGELYITLPEGLTYREEQNVMELYQGETLIGGMTGYEVDAQAVLNWQGTSPWLHTLLEEGNSPNFGYMGGSRLYGDYEVNFFTDVPPETEIERVDRLHTFFYNEKRTAVYDVWFDTLVTTNTLRNDILKTVTGIWEEQPQETEVTEAPIIPENAVSFTDLYSGHDGTAEFVIFTGPLDREALEVENGLTLEQLLEKAKEEFQSTRVNSFGFDPEAMGHEGRTTVEICITDLRKGEDYLIAKDTPVPTIELWGYRYYHFENGDTMKVEEEPFEIMLMNAMDGTILARIGLDQH